MQVKFPSVFQKLYKKSSSLVKLQPSNSSAMDKKIFTNKIRTAKSYSFIEVVGKGQYSKVWKATDNVSGETVAIKEIHKHSTTWKHFNKEVKFGQLVTNHPNISTTRNLASGRKKSSYFIVQDFATGGNLCGQIRLHSRIPETTSKRYFHQICSAVQHMHNMNLVHLDIKLDNIVLQDPTGTLVKLLDFGMTERVGKKLNSPHGTIHYMAPEMFDHHDLPVKGLTAKTSLDIWSLGISLFCMVTGRYPWLQATMTDSDYSQYYCWQAGISSSPPEQWMEFTPALSQLLTALLAVKAKHRCDIPHAMSYFDEKWLVTD